MRERRRRWAIALGLLAMAVGCGDPVAGDNYRGDPLASVQGKVVLGGGPSPANNLYVVVGWRKEDSPNDTWTGEVVDVAGGFPASYVVDLLKPPPTEALNVDPETGGKLGFAFVVLMEDVNGNGALDVDQSVQGLPSGPDRFRGGAETMVLAYAADPFAASSAIGKALGTSLSVGYHLMKADDKYRCIWQEDRRDWTCPNAKTMLQLVPLSTPVDLKVIDKPTEFSPVHSPDWLFLE